MSIALKEDIFKLHTLGKFVKPDIVILIGKKRRKGAYLSHWVADLINEDFTNPSISKNFNVLYREKKN